MYDSFTANFLTCAGADRGRAQDNEDFKLRRARIAQIRTTLDEIAAETQAMLDDMAVPSAGHHEVKRIPRDLQQALTRWTEPKQLLAC